MEKPSRSKGNKIFNFIPKLTSFSIPQRPYSPGGHGNQGKAKALYRKTFSGPIVSIVPAEARRKEKNGGGFDTQEPTSPKVSCMGQVKGKKKRAVSQWKRPPSPTAAPPQKKEPAFSVSKMFQRKVIRHGLQGSSDAAADQSDGRRPAAAHDAGAAAAPSLGRMKRFASGRETLGEFDWRKAQREQLTDAAGDSCSGEWFSDEDSDGDDDVIMSYSAPILVGGGAVAVEPRKEVNLWKRRTITPPPPLEFK